MYLVSQAYKSGQPKLRIKLRLIYDQLNQIRTWSQGNCQSDFGDLQSITFSIFEYGFRFKNKMGACACRFIFSFHSQWFWKEFFKFLPCFAFGIVNLGKFSKYLNGKETIFLDPTLLHEIETIMKDSCQNNRTKIFNIRTEA